MDIDVPTSFFIKREYFCCVQDECQEYYFALSGKDAASRRINDYEIHSHRLDGTSPKLHFEFLYRDRDNMFSKS